MKNHIYKTRLIIIAITIACTAIFFAVVSSQYNSDNAALRQLALKIDYKWYSLTHDMDDLQAVNTTDHAQGIPVLVYHGITKLSDRFNMTQTQFTDQMFALKQAGYETVTPDQFTAYLRGEIQLPVKSFLLTFDDGRKDSYYGADPVLHFLGFKATMFIATHQSLDDGRQTYYLSPAELSYMEKTGRWFIESHAKQNDGGYVVIDANGATGNFLTNLKWLPEQKRLENVDEYTKRITDELVGSKEQIEKTFQTKVSLFSYPFGDYGTQTVNFPGSAPIIQNIISQTYTAAFHQIWPVDYSFLYNKQDESRSLMKRLEPSPTLGGVDLVNTLNISAPKSLPFKDDFSVNRGWKHSWGTVAIAPEKKMMVLSGETTNHGAYAYLDGSAIWKNYIVTAHVNASNNSDFSIAARFNDEDNYVDCFYSNGTVQIRNIINKKSEKIIQSKNNYVFDPQNAIVGIAVEGNTVSCLLNNHIVLRQKISNLKFIDGGIGLGMWSNNVAAQVSYSSLSVEEVTGSVVSMVSKMAVTPLAILAGEVVYHEDSYLPKQYPAYGSQNVKKILTSIENRDYSPAVSSTDNLVPNPNFTEIGVDGIPVSWHKNIYSQTEANFTFSLDAGLGLAVIKISDDGQAGWYFDPVPVTPGDEYVVSGTYSATSPALFVVEYKMENGTYNQDRMEWLVPVNENVGVKSTVRVPVGAKEMTAYFMLESTGSVHIKTMSLQKLESGAFEKGMVTFNFDDGFATSYTDVSPLLKKLGFVATHYIISDYVGYDRYMSPAQIASLEKAGNEVGAHTTKHPRLTLLSGGDLVHEIQGSKKDLTNMGFAISTFDYPYGSVNNFVRAQVVNAGYTGARSTLRGFNTKNTDPFMLRDQHVDKDSTFEEIKSYIDKAVEDKTWLVLEFHDTISNDRSQGEAISPKLLSQILTYVKQSHVEVVTTKQGLALMKK